MAFARRETARRWQAPARHLPGSPSGWALCWKENCSENRDFLLYLKERRRMKGLILEIPQRARNREHFLLLPSSSSTYPSSSKSRCSIPAISKSLPLRQLKGFGSAAARCRDAARAATSTVSRVTKLRSQNAFHRPSRSHFRKHTGSIKSSELKISAETRAESRGCSAWSGEASGEDLSVASQCLEGAVGKWGTDF